MSLRESIQSAFADVQHPGKDKTTKCTWPGCPECEDISQTFGGKSALSVEDGVLAEHTALPLFTPEAFHYFIPAYMLYSLRHPDSDVAFFIRQGLGEAGIDTFYLERFRLFTVQQKQAVIAFLEFLRSQEIEGDDRDQHEYEEKIDADIKIWKGMA